MILPALIGYYERLEADPDEDIAPLGFSRQKISFCIVLNPDGTLRAIEDMRQPPEKGSGKPMARQLVVPGQSKPSGQGINPCFLWDNGAYMLGYKADDPKPERTRACFEAFRDRHLAIVKGMEPGPDRDTIDVVCAFLKAWNPSAFTPGESTAEYLTGFGVFRVLPAQELVHERAGIQRWWVEQEASDEQEALGEDELVPSLTTGRVSRIARLHEPAIKGVFGAQSSGARLVSFNENAFTSYGKSQGMNAPVAEDDAFRYCTALNRLLNDRSRRTGIGDATVVWWSQASGEVGEVGESMVGALFGVTPPESAEDAGTSDRVGAAMSRISRGLVPDGLEDSRVRFHVLGLSPNAARLSVRFWWDGTLGEMVGHIAQHHADLRLDPVPERDRGRPFSIRRMVMETARQHGGKSDADTVSPTLAGEVTRAVLNGGPYPMALLESIIRRVRADGRVSHARCSIIKACITRRRRVLAGGGGQPAEEILMSLNKDGPPAYQLGRLFATLEKTQSDALGDIGAGIRDRYFGTASATPASVFPRLIRLTQHHMGKLEGGRLVNREKLMGEICSHMEAFPRHLSLEDQGMFQIGYYHQRQDFFQKTTDKNTNDQSQEED